MLMLWTLMSILELVIAISQLMWLQKANSTHDARRRMTVSR
jgi:hypothetical protein